MRKKRLARTVWAREEMLVPVAAEVGVKLEENGDDRLWRGKSFNEAW